jgi:transcriptional/translational regulatory protein YebC/TACO1
LITIVGLGAVAAARSALRSIVKSKNEEESVFSGSTEHASTRSKERDISQEQIDSAIKNGTVSTKIGKYGTRQVHFEGSNGVTVVVETEGRNAGKVITVWSKN